jgi:hypothetical protein
VRPRDLAIAGGLALAGLLALRGQETIETVEDFVTTELTDDFTRWDALIRNSSRKWNVPWRWIKAICWVESNLGRAPSVARGIESPNDVEGSKSSDGKSWGLMQVTLSTAQWLVPGVSVYDLNQPAVSLDLGARYLRWLMDRPASNGGDREWVIRGYNGGPGWAVTVVGPAATAVYYTRFINRLDQIMAKQPGNEREVG